VTQAPNPQPPSLTQAYQAILAAIHARHSSLHAPLLVALDGGSGAGKSTLAALLTEHLHVAWIPLDDFFSAHVPDAGWDARSIPDRARDVFDWHCVRAQALEPLLAGQPARWHPIDFVSGPRPDGTYRLRAEPESRSPAPLLLLDGAYSSGPQLVDLVGLSVLVDVPVEVRHARLAAREDPAFLAQWHARWDAVETHYFTVVRPRSSFDLVVTP
jgi:para-aminobenzoate synthetase